MNHKLIVVYDSFDDEDQARWYGQHLATTDDHVSDIYVVLDQKNDPQPNPHTVQGYDLKAGVKLIKDNDI